MTIKAVIFDIGGVVVGSPVAAISRAEREWGLPPHYLNGLITAYGDEGAFQRFERGQIEIDEFYRQFGTQLSDVERGNDAYRKYCHRVGQECPPLPKSLKVDGKDLWTRMMDPSLDPDPVVVTAINRLRASGKYKIAALTNNFAPSGDVPSRYVSNGTFRPVSPRELAESLRRSARAHDEAKGSGDALLKSLFDEYVESCIEGVRKPDPRFYQIALDKLGIRGDEAVFLDDIGQLLT
ncbi:hypothetical protein JCM10212_001146 [Sporobolomyces blumeae]